MYLSSLQLGTALLVATLATFAHAWVLAPAPGNKQLVEGRSAVKATARPWQYPRNFEGLSPDADSTATKYLGKSGYVFIRFANKSPFSF